MSPFDTRDHLSSTRDILTPTHPPTPRIACAVDAPFATMSAPTGEAPPPSTAPAAPAPQPAPAPPPAPASAPVVPQLPVSGATAATVANVANVAQAGPSHSAVPVAQAQGHQQQQQQQAPPRTGAPGGPAAAVPRQPAAPTRDTFTMRSLGPAVNSQVKKVCETLPSSTSLLTLGFPCANTIASFLETTLKTCTPCLTTPPLGPNCDSQDGCPCGARGF